MTSSDFKLILWLTDEIISWIYKDTSVYQSYFVGANNLCLALGRGYVGAVR